MKIFGLTLARSRPAADEKALTSLPGGRGGWFRILESFTGAWQRNVTVDRNAVLAFHAVFACQTLIASDIAKLRIKLVSKGASGIWTETQSAAFSPVLRKPNHFQTRIQFIENWVLSKLQSGNTYVLKQRDGRGVVTRHYVLDPNLVLPLISDSGDIYYQLSADKVSGIHETVTVPASEIIHDRFNCLFHPLVGISPIYANGLAATQGIAIQNASASFFKNNCQPGGLLVAPGKIDEANAARLKAQWEEKFTGDNAGRIAVLGDGLKFESLAVKAVDAQLIEQLKWNAEVVCSTYHVPPYKIGIGQMPTHNNVQALNVEYYTQCLQILIEAIELLLDEGLGIGEGVKSVGGVEYGVELDTENLLRMDSATQMDVLEKGRNYLTPDEGRAKLGLEPTEGGNVVYRQQQDYSLAALAKRDAKDDPFAKAETRPGAPSDADAANDNAIEAEAAKALLAVHKGFG